MARNRPGKRERQNATRDAFQRERAAIMARNAQEAKPERPVKPSRGAVALLGAAGASTRYVAPKGLRNSVLARDSLKSASHDIGFIGPRGYHTPTDKVGKREAEKGLLASSRRTMAERQDALALAASVTFNRPTQKD